MDWRGAFLPLFCLICIPWGFVCVASYAAAEGEPGIIVDCSGGSHAEVDGLVYLCGWEIR